MTKHGYFAYFLNACLKINIILILQQQRSMRIGSPAASLFFLPTLTDIVFVTSLTQINCQVKFFVLFCFLVWASLWGILNPQKKFQRCSVHHAPLVPPARHPCDSGVPILFRSEVTEGIISFRCLLSWSWRLPCTSY